MFDRNEGQEIGSELIAQPYIDSAFVMANEMRARAWPGIICLEGLRCALQRRYFVQAGMVLFIHSFVSWCH